MKRIFYGHFISCCQRRHVFRYFKSPHVFRHSIILPCGTKASGYNSAADLCATRSYQCCRGSSQAPPCLSIIPCTICRLPPKTRSEQEHLSGEFFSKPRRHSDQDWFGIRRHPSLQINSHAVEAHPFRTCHVCQLR